MAGRAQERLERLISLGLARRRDYVDPRTGAIDKAAQDRIRRLHRKIEPGGVLRRYLRSPDYAAIRTPDAASRKRIQQATPEELRAQRIPLTFVRVGAELRGGRLVPRKVQSVATRKDGSVTIRTRDGAVRRYVPIDRKAFVVDPRAEAARIVAQEGADRDRIRYEVVTGFGGSGRLAAMFAGEDFPELLELQIERYLEIDAPSEDPEELEEQRAERAEIAERARESIQGVIVTVLPEPSPLAVRRKKVVRKKGRKR